MHLIIRLCLALSTSLGISQVAVTGSAKAKANAAYTETQKTSHTAYEATKPAEAPKYEVAEAAKPAAKPEKTEQRGNSDYGHARAEQGGHAYGHAKIKVKVGGAAEYTKPAEAQKPAEAPKYEAQPAEAQKPTEAPKYEAKPVEAPKYEVAEPKPAEAPKYEVAEPKREEKPAQAQKPEYAPAAPNGGLLLTGQIKINLGAEAKGSSWTETKGAAKAEKGPAQAEKSAPKAEKASCAQ